MSNELKPCPFCGGGGEIINTHTASFWVRCQGCRAEAHGKYFDGPGRKNRFVYSEKPKGPFEVDYAGLHPEYKAAFNSACEAWNTRAPAPVPTSAPAGQHDLACSCAECLKLGRQGIKRSTPVPTSGAVEAFDAFAAKYDHEGDEWLDMDVREYFKAGWQAALATQPPAADGKLGSE